MPSRSSLTNRRVLKIAEFVCVVFIAVVAFVLAFDSVASVTSVAFVTSLFFDLSSIALVLSNPAL